MLFIPKLAFLATVKIISCSRIWWNSISLVMVWYRRFSRRHILFFILLIMCYQYRSIFSYFLQNITETLQPILIIKYIIFKIKSEIVRRSMGRDAKLIVAGSTFCRENRSWHEYFQNCTKNVLIQLTQI